MKGSHFHSAGPEQQIVLPNFTFLHKKHMLWVFIRIASVNFSIKTYVVGIH